MYYVLRIIFALAAVFLSYKWLKIIRIRKKLSWIPQVNGWPILGNLLEFGGTTDLLDDMSRLINQHGKLISLDILGTFFVVSADYSFNEFLLSTQDILNKGSSYVYFHNWLGTGLLTSTGAKWKKRRRLITPAFHFSILEQFVGMFEANGNVLIKKLEKRLNEEIDIYHYINLYALDVICESAMGVTVNAQKEEESKYVQCVKRVCQIIVERSVGSIKSFPLFYPLCPDFYAEKRAVNTIHSFTFSVIDSRREKLKSERQLYENQEDAVGRKKRFTFIDTLLQSTTLSREDIREEVDTFMFAGHDTSSSAISFAILLLSQYAEVQRRVFDEQRRIFFDDFHRPATYENLQEMKYLNCVLKETLRLYPSVPLFVRETNKDIEYKGNTIPKGVNITIFAYKVMRDPKYFPNPDKFHPSRFENIDGKHPYAYIPFSAGPRNCIGQKFAMLEMKNTLSKILRNFEILPVSKHKIILAAETILKPKNGIKIKLSKREIL